MRLIDTHCHLLEPQFAGDRDAVIDRAVAAGVDRLVTLGVDLPSSEAAAGLAAGRAEVYAAAGFHPHDAVAFRPGDEVRLAELAARPKVVAIGEIGLDFFRNHSPRDIQIGVFRRQLDLAVELDRPVAIHDREAHEAMADELRDWVRRHPRRPDPPGVMHCFSGDLALAQACVGWGFMISLAGPLTYPKSTRLAEVAARVPLDYLVVETDSPYLPPQQRRGQRNDPTGVRAVAERLADLRGLPVQEVASITSANAVRLFRLPD
ncbi:MAG TPA: TatD family hydrolase [Dehalococcoidia bacterium]|nr:TatD family hydrolase [Dehalococcoidia bacterium]